MTFTCADQDGLSGVLSCPAAKTLGEGANQSAGGYATDAADNVSDVFSITGVNVDKTDPTLSGAATTAPNGDGWYKRRRDGRSGLPPTHCPGSTAPRQPTARSPARATPCRPAPR